MCIASRIRSCWWPVSHSQYKQWTKTEWNSQSEWSFRKGQDLFVSGHVCCYALSVQEHSMNSKTGREKKKKHWALRPQKSLRLIRDGEVGAVRNFISHTYSLHCHHQNDSALRWAVVWAILMFHLLCGQSHKTESINCNFWREEKGEPKWIEPRSFCLPAKRLTAKPHWLTGRGAVT